MTYILFLLGFVALIKGADMLVDGAGSMAKRWNISDLVIGLTIVAFGSSTPELIIALLAALQGNGDLVLGNVLGSNLANILLILGISAMIRPLVVHKNTIWKEIPLSLLAIVVLGVLANDVLLDGTVTSALTRIDGIILLAFFIVFMYYTFGITKVNDKVDTDDISIHPLWKSTVLVIVGLIGLTLGGKWIVDGAVMVATSFGISDRLIGLTIVAVGTSLPELAASGVAAAKGQTDIAIGNVVGSNIFNIFWVAAWSAIIAPLAVSVTQNLDIFAVILASLLLFLFIFIGKHRHVLSRVQGGLFVAMYVSFMIYTIFWT